MTTPAAFAAQFPFALDEFQMQAAEAVDAGMSVLVAAPTGSGKTVVAEYAIERALGAAAARPSTRRPLKALSNQKFGDLVAKHGADRVGLLTGDNTINSEAPVVVMTTEVLRNMLYERSDTLQRPRERRDGRGPLPAGPLPRRRLGRGADPPAAQRERRLPVGDDLQRRGVRRVGRHAAR